jgi:hypothetical protein
MKKLMVLLFICPAFSSFGFDKISQAYLGLDLSQFNYMVSKKAAFNAGLFGQYKPFSFLSLNASMIVNNVYEERGQGYSQLEDYESHGFCFKAGFDLSLRISRNRKSRAFWGYNGAVINSRESGRFVLDNLYWSPHNYGYQLPSRTFYAAEWVLGFQFEGRKLVFRPQFYGLFNVHDKKISYNDEVAQGYRSPFIPGFGYVRGGINFILMYRLTE